jgi:hypothetical protein
MGQKLASPRELEAQIELFLDVSKISTQASISTFRRILLILPRRDYAPFGKAVLLLEEILVQRYF